MKQQSISDIEYGNRKRRTKRETFLEAMDAVIPWDEMVALIEPHYYSGKRGRPPRKIETMLRMYLLQEWFTLADEGVVLGYRLLCTCFERFIAGANTWLAIVKEQSEANSVFYRC